MASLLEKGKLLKGLLTRERAFVGPSMPLWMLPGVATSIARAVLTTR